MHGASLPGRGERRGAGRAYGSLSNLVTAFTAVVWSRRRRRYVLRAFDRADPDAKAFLVHLGRAFITEVTLRLAPDQNVRCVSHIDIPANELFAPPGSSGRTFQSFLDQTGRVESIWFPFTESPWLKVWSVEPEKPLPSRRVSGPYNYPFSDSVPLEVAELAAAIIEGNTALTPLFCRAEHNVVRAGLPATGSADIWGPSRTTLYYIRESTLRVDEHGYAVLTKRSNVQRVLHAFAAFHERRLSELRAQGLFPINGPVEMRSCGVDHPHHAGVRGAEAPALAPTVPRRDRRGWDTAIWINVLTFAGTPGQTSYYREIEEWMRANYRGYAMLRPEWSKGWACTDEAQWDDPIAIKRLIPHSLQVGRHDDEDWNWAVRTLDRHDPHRVFSNGFLDRLLRPR
jgi:FAD/FMN-containing dehydrogenase